MSVKNVVKALEAFISNCELRKEVTGSFGFLEESYKQGKLALAEYAAAKASVVPIDSDLDAMVSRFLAWPIPETVRPDQCVMDVSYPHRFGTNLMNAPEAKSMLEHVLGIPPDSSKLVPITGMRGQLVVPKGNGQQLRSGGCAYSYAVCISEEPFILVSEAGDMRWSTLKKEDFDTCGMPSNAVIANVNNRILRDASIDNKLVLEPVQE